jgi:flavin-dependent dehydrogenase
MRGVVLIVGGGVAGSALALRLCRLGLRCIVLERSAARPATQYEVREHRSAGATQVPVGGPELQFSISPSPPGAASAHVGEHLPPEAAPYLGQLGLWESFRAAGHFASLASSGTRAAWGSAEPHDREYIFSPYGPGWNLDRTHFDAWLLAAAGEAGAEVYHDATVTIVHPRALGWDVEAVIAGEKVTFRPAFLVDATGRASAIARRLGSRRLTRDHLVAVIGWAGAGEAPQGPDRSPVPGGDVAADTTLLVEAVPDGWWYTAALPGGARVAAFMTDPPLWSNRRQSLAAFWLDRLAETTYVRERMASPGGQVIVRPAGTWRTDPLYPQGAFPCPAPRESGPGGSGPGWLAVGDAAAALDPLSSMGITRALASGLAAAGAIARHLDGDPDALAEYASDITWAYEVQLAARTRYYAQEQRWPARPFWQRRHRDRALLPPITLDPFTRLQAADPRGSGRWEHESIRLHRPVTLGSVPYPLPVSDLRLLQRLCAAPIPAYEAARAFKQAANRPVDDERLIRTIEYALATGVLSALSERSEVP